MSIYWIVLADGRAGSMVVTHRQVLPDDGALSLKAFAERELARDGADAEVLTMQTLPYAASPILIGDDIPFCLHPHKCAGHTSCPRNRSCCD